MRAVRGSYWFVEGFEAPGLTPAQRENADGGQQRDAAAWTFHCGDPGKIGEAIRDKKEQSVSL